MVSAELQFRSLFAIVSDSILIKRAEVKSWNVILKQAKVTRRDSAALRKLKVRIDIGLAPVAPKRTVNVFELVDHRYRLKTLVYFNLGKLCQRLHHHTES